MTKQKILEEVLYIGKQASPDVLTANSFADRVRALVIAEVNKIMAADLGVALTADSALDRLLRKSVLTGTETADSAGRILFQLFQQATAAAPVANSALDRIKSTPLIARRVISTAGQESIGRFTDGRVALGNSSVFTANQAVYVPCYLDVGITVTRMAVFNAGTVAGDFDVGLYNSSGTRLVASGTTVQSGASVPQVLDVTDTVIAAGLIYFGFVTNSGTATFFGNQMSENINRMMGVHAETLASALLPATAVFASYTGANKGVPLVTASTYSLI